MLSRYRALFLSAGVIAAFLFGHYVFGRDNAKIVMDSLVVGAAVTICVTWAQAAIGALRRGLPDGAANIQVGVWMVFTLLFMYFGWLIVFAASGRAEWLRDLPVSGLFSTLFFLAGSYLVLAPVNTRETISRPSLVRWLVAVSMGSLVAGGLITASVLKIIQVVT